MAALSSTRAVAAAGLAAALVGAGCGGSEALAPAAEPAESPPLSARPAGRVVPAGTRPEGLVFDSGSGLVAIGTRAPNELVLYDPAAHRVVKRIPLAGAPRHLASSGPGNVLVPAEQIDELLSVSIPGGATEMTMVGAHPHDATAAAGRIFLADEFGDSVSVVQGGKLTDSLPAPQQPGGIAAVEDRYVVVVAVSERRVEAYDARTLEPVGEVAGGAGPTHVATLGDRAYVTDTQGGAILAYRVGPGLEALGSSPAPGSPYGIVADPARQMLWVTLTARNELIGLALGDGKLTRVASYPTVRQPDSVAVDPASGDVFVAGRSDGVIEQIHTDGQTGAAGAR